MKGWHLLLVYNQAGFSCKRKRQRPIELAEAALPPEGRHLRLGFSPVKLKAGCYL